MTVMGLPCVYVWVVFDCRLENILREDNGKNGAVLVAIFFNGDYPLQNAAYERRKDGHSVSDLPWISRRPDQPGKNPACDSPSTLKQETNTIITSYRPRKHFSLSLSFSEALVSAKTRKRKDREDPEPGFRANAKSSRKIVSRVARVSLLSCSVIVVEKRWRLCL